MRRVISLVCLIALALPSAAEVELDRVVSVRRSVEGDKIRLVIETEKRLPEASAYFLTGPDRLVVELNDTKAGATLPSKPADPMVGSWALKTTALNRCALTLSLNYAPPSSEIEISTVDSPPRLVVEFDARPGVKEQFSLTDGITWIREDRVLAGGWVRLNRLLFNPEDPNIEVVLGLAKEKTNAREPLSDMVKRYNAVAGINGGFFAGSGGALGLVYREGQMLVPHVSRRPPRSGFGITKDGKALFGRIAATGTQIKDLDGGDWSGAWLALGGGPRLVQNGLAKVTADLEELGPKGNDITRVAARTLVGLTENGQLMFSTVTGYHDNHKQGLKFEPLVGWLKSVQVKEAVNFDGGASVDMVIGNHIVSDGPANRSKEKPVATALMVRDKRADLSCQRADWNFRMPFLAADGAMETELEIDLKTADGRAVADGMPVRFFARGVTIDPAVTRTSGGKVKVKARSVRRPGTAVVTLMAGPLTEHKSYPLQAGKATRVMILQTEGVASKAQEGAQKAVVKVQTLDQWGNAVEGEPFQCSLDGGPKSDFKTDKSGIMALELDLPLTGGVFQVFHESGNLEHHIGPVSK